MKSFPYFISIFHDYLPVFRYNWIIIGEKQEETMNVGDKIRYFRKSKNLSQQSLANGICSVSYLSKIENNQIEPSSEILLFLSNRLGISLKHEDKEDEIQRVINKWYKALFNRNAKESQHIIQQIREFNITSVEFQITVKLLEVWHYLLQNEIQKAKENIAFLEISHETLKHRLSFMYLLVQALLHYHLRKYNDSYTYLIQADSELKQITFEEWEKGYIHYLQGLVSSQLGRYTNCLDFIRTAVEIFESLYMFKKCADCRLLMGVTYQRIGNIEEAKKQLLLAQGIAESFNDSGMLGAIAQNLGYIESKNGNSKEAIMHYLLSLGLKEKLSSDDQVTTIFTLIEEYHKLGEHEKGLKYVKKGLEITIGKESLLEYELHYQYYLRVFQYGMNHEETIHYLIHTVIPFLEEKQKWLHLSEYCQFVGSYYEQQLKYKPASYYFCKTVNALRNLI
jgi:HTH-type transcriptional regulator, quorum sensing regulator NprR